MLEEEKPPAFFGLNTLSHSLDFYTQQINHYQNFQELPNKPKGTWIYTDVNGKKLLEDYAPGAFSTYETFQFFAAANLKINFLLREKRAGMWKERYLLVLEEPLR